MGRPTEATGAHSMSSQFSFGEKIDFPAQMCVQQVRTAVREATVFMSVTLMARFIARSLCIEEGEQLEPPQGLMSDMAADE